MDFEPSLVILRENGPHISSMIVRGVFNAIQVFSSSADVTVHVKTLVVDWHTNSRSSPGQMTTADAVCRNTTTARKCYDSI